MKIVAATAADYHYMRTHDRHIREKLIMPKIDGREIHMLKVEERTIGWMRHSYFWDNTPFMNLIWIDEPYRSNGYGREAMLFWEEQMRQEGYRLVMTSTQANEGAQHFYRKLGYRDSGCLWLEDEPLEIMLTKALKQGEG